MQQKFVSSVYIGREETNAIKERTMNEIKTGDSVLVPLPHGDNPDLVSATPSFFMNIFLL